MSLNKVMLIGNLGKDPEQRFTQKGTAVCSFSVATTERVKDATGNWADHTEWHRITTWGKTAENCGKYLKKGRPVFIEGKIRQSKYTDKNGQERYSFEIVADNVTFLGRGDGRSEGAAPVNDFSPEEQSVGNKVLASLPSADQLGGRSDEPAAVGEDDIPF